ncbi:tyrosine-protein kinase domain-containing protein [Phytohabitans suffuscus]
MDLRDYLHAVRKRWWLVLLAVAAAAGVAALVTALTPARYATSTTFFVTTASQGVSDAYQGDLFSQQRVKSYTDLLTSDRLARAVAGRGDHGLTSAEVQARVSAKAVPGTVLLRSTVTDRDGERSRAVAEAVASEFTALVEELETPPGKSTSSVKVAVVSGPTLQSTPVAPQPLRNYTVALLVGLVIGAAAAVLRDILDTTVRGAESLRDVTPAPLLGTIPFDVTARQSPLIVADQRRSVRAEALRQLRTNLQFVDVDRAARSIVVTSSVPDEGKSATAANLAIMFAEGGRRVLLVEADMRRPRVAEYLGLEGAIGLSNVLAGQADIDDVLQRWGRLDLWVLASGALPPNPSELLGSQALVDLLDRMRERFDIVIIDTPPLLPVTDAAVATVRADGALVVVRCGRTTRPQVATAVRALAAVDARLLGFVLNMTPPARNEDYYYQSHGPEALPRLDRPDVAGPPAARSTGQTSDATAPVRSAR